MINIEKILAGVFAGAGGLYLIHLGYIETGAVIISTMLGFFIGDWNGRKTTKNTA